MSDGRRTAKLKTQRECSLCGGARVAPYGVFAATGRIVLICLKCDRPSGVL